MKFERKNPIIILIAGKAGSGKSTLSRYIMEEYIKQGKKVIISPYSKYLKQYISEITGQAVTDENKPRELLQKISSELIKKKLKKENFFLERQLEDLEIYSYFAEVILVPDVRFPNEIEEVKKQFSNVISVGVIRKNFVSKLTKEQQLDITETALDDYDKYDYQIENTKTEVLKEQARIIVTEYKERR